VIRLLKGEDDMHTITFIVLIPKVANLEELGQLRPISLCNVIFKIASKVAANRLKVCLTEIIAEEQSTFVLGRLVTNNNITAYNCLYFTKTNIVKKNSSCAMKLDIQKVYDWLE
jgi:hypothetical protein